MRIPSGVVDQYIYFYAVDAQDFTTPEVGLVDSNEFIIWAARDGGAAAAFTTPTVTEVDATNMPGVYSLLLDEYTTLSAGNDSEELVLHITQAPQMAPVVRTIELYRPKITAGETLTVSSGAVSSVTSVSGAVGSVSATVSADVVSVSGDSTAADNLELQYDGTGLTGDTYPATQQQIGSLNTGSAAISVTAGAGSTVTTGTENGTTYTNTSALDGVYHQVVAAAGNTDFYYEFSVGGDGVPVEFIWNGYAQSVNDSYTVSGYDWGNTAWVQIGTIDGAVGTTDTSQTFQATLAMVGTGVNIGLVRLQFTSADGTNIFTDRVLCSYAVVARSVGYALGAIWVDTTGSNTSSEPYVDGTADNPVSSWTAAKALSASLGLKRFKLTTDSAITLDANSDAYEIGGGTIALGGQSISGARFMECSVSGTATGATLPTFHDCTIAGITVPRAYLWNCGLYNAAAITMSSTGDLSLVDCFSQVAGAATAGIDLGGAVGASNVIFRRYGGGLQIDNIAAGDTISAEATVGGSLVLNGADGTVEIRGMWKRVTDNRTGTPLGTDFAIDLANINAQVDTAFTDYDPPTNTEMVAAFTEIKGATWATTDTLENIRDELVVVDGVVDTILIDTADMQPKLGTPAADVSADIAAIKAETATIVADTNELQTDDVPGLIAALNDLDAAGVAAATWNAATATYGTAGSYGLLVETNLDAPVSGATAPTAAAVADAVWDEDVSTHNVLQSSAVYLKDGHNHAESNATQLGVAGAGLTDLGGMSTGMKAEITAQVPTVTENADALLNRDMSAVSDTNARSPLNSLRLLRNKYSIAAGTLTVTKENDTTTAWTSTMTTDAAADPITGSDPA